MVSRCISEFSAIGSEGVDGKMITMKTTSETNQVVNTGTPVKQRAREFAVSCESARKQPGGRGALGHGRELEGPALARTQILLRARDIRR